MADMCACVLGSGDPHATCQSGAGEGTLNGLVRDRESFGPGGRHCRGTLWDPVLAEIHGHGVPVPTDPGTVRRAHANPRAGRGSGEGARCEWVSLWEAASLSEAGVVEIDGLAVPTDGGRCSQTDL